MLRHYNGNGFQGVIDQAELLEVVVEVLRLPSSGSFGMTK
jgi:hypothetical protein